MLKSDDADKSGAHILLLARGKDTLETAKNEVGSYRRSSTQTVAAMRTDLCDQVAVSLSYKMRYISEDTNIFERLIYKFSG